MRHILSVIIIAALLAATAVEVVAGWTKMNAPRKHYAAPADSDYEKVAEHALAMLKAVYLREGPDAAVSSAKYMVEAAAIVIANELGPAETRRFLHFVGVRRGQEH